MEILIAEVSSFHKAVTVTPVAALLLNSIEFVLGETSMGRSASIYCPYCHEHTLVVAAPMTFISDDRREYTLQQSASWQADNDASWWIGVCQNVECKQPVLVLNEGDEVYPQPMPSPTDGRIPEPMRTDLTEAKTCFSAKAFRGCAVLARRAIQSACIHNKADNGKTLEKQIDELATKGTITDSLKKWAHAVRWIGNDAAHPKAKHPVKKEDAEDILKLAEEFLEAIYVTPKIAEEQAKLRASKKKDSQH